MSEADTREANLNITFATLEPAAVAALLGAALEEMYGGNEDAAFDVVWHMADQFGVIETGPGDPEKS